MRKIILPTFDPEIQPDRLAPGYKSTILRAPAQPFIPLREAMRDFSRPVYSQVNFGKYDNDLTKNAMKNGDPLGERIIVHGQVRDESGYPLAGALVEMWQANAAGRYVHKVDQHEAPLDPNFLGVGRCLTDKDGYYTFTTIKPGAYPWQNHHNAWRPNHLHFSLFGSGITSRLVTQMYFPGDPLLDYDPVFLSVPPKGRDLLIAKFDLDITQPSFALGYRFDMVLRGYHETPFENR